MEGVTSVLYQGVIYVVYTVVIQIIFFNWFESCPLGQYNVVRSYTILHAVVQAKETR